MATRTPAMAKLNETASGASTIVRRALPQEIVDRLRAEIVSGRWAPGERLTEQSMALHFGVSRTPLREAFKVVAAEGLLELLPNRGAVIAEPTLTEAHNKMRVLGALEALAAELACEAATDEQIAELERLHAKVLDAHRRGQAQRYFELNDEFHLALVRAAHNQTLSDLHAIAFRHVKQARLITEFRDTLHDTSIVEHGEIMQALRKRDPKAAQRAIESHMATIRESLIGIKAATPRPARTARRPA
ncbi:MAG: GntR family transcriptional regulator [Burkholderiaceae bacterium]